MTIGVGILCSDGVVVGADQEITRGTFKGQERKTFLLRTINVAIGLVGAGTFSLISLAQQELQRRLVENMTLDQVEALVAELAQEIYSKHVQNNSNHSLDLLLGVKTTPKGGARQVALLRVEDSIVVRRDRYEAIGSGADLADYLLAGLYNDAATTTVAHGIMIAAQVIKQAKTYARYSGGQTDLIHVRLGYVSNFVPEDDIRIHEESAEKFAKIIRPLALAMTDININDTKLEDIIGKASVELNAFRPEAFRNAQRAVFAQEAPVRILVTQENHSSMVFGPVETSAAPMDDD